MEKDDRGISIMKLYIVYWWVDWEGGDIVGVYDDFDKATEHLIKIKGKGSGQSIKEVEMNKEFDLSV